MGMQQKQTIYLDRNESQYGPAPACFEALKNIDGLTLTPPRPRLQRGRPRIAFSMQA